MFDKPVVVYRFAVIILVAGLCSTVFGASVRRWDTKQEHEAYQYGIKGVVVDESAWSTPAEQRAYRLGLLSCRVETLASSLKDAEAKAEDDADDLEKASRELEKLKAKIVDLAEDRKSEKGKSAAVVSVLKASIKVLEDDIDQLQDELRATESQSKNAQKEFSKLQKREGDLEECLEELAVRNVELLAAAKVVGIEAGVLGKSLKDAEDKIEDLEKERNKLTVSLEALEAKKMKTGRSNKKPFFGGMFGKAKQSPLEDGKLVCKFKTKEAEKVFLDSYAGKQARVQELTVIARILKEKQRELSTFSQELEKTFFINPDENYQYDSKTKTIFRVLKSDVSGGKKAKKSGKEGELQKKAHMRLTKPQNVKTFLRLVASKQLTVSEMSSLNLLLKEKQIERARFEAILKKKYGVERSSQYRYDSDSMGLYLLASGNTVK